MSEIGESPLAAGDRQLSVAQARKASAEALRSITNTPEIWIADATHTACH